MWGLRILADGSRDGLVEIQRLLDLDIGYGLHLIVISDKKVTFYNTHDMLSSLLLRKKPTFYNINSLK